MNIALVCDYSLDYLGGAQTAFSEQVRALVAAGHRVVVIAPRGKRTSIGGSAHEWIDAPFRIPFIDLPYLRNTELLRSRIAQILARHRIEVVHLHSEFGLAAATIDAAAAAHVRVAHTVHTFFWRAGPLPIVVGLIAAAAIRALHFRMTGQASPSGRLEGPPADVALREMTLATAALADVVISPSEHQRVRLIAAGLRRVVTIPNTVAVTGPRPAALDRIGVDNRGPLRLVWIGRCAPEKRLPEFVAACAQALDALGPNTLEVEIVGDGPQLNRARRIAAGHPQISFSGRVPSTAVAAKLERAHVAALTSFGFDNQPMTVVEALFAARPVLYVDPALREGLDTAGLLCRDKSVDGMAAMLIDLARDPDRVVRASARAHLAFDLFAADTFVKETESTYRSLLPGYRRIAVETELRWTAPTS
jgi:glycosyltransferase involved in cell wall biosynthesis